MPDAWSSNVEVTGMTQTGRKVHGESTNGTQACRFRGGGLTAWPTRRCNGWKKHAGPEMKSAVSLKTEMAEDVLAPYGPAGEKNRDDDNDVLSDGSFFFCLPSHISGLHHFGGDFCVCDRFVLFVCLFFVCLFVYLFVWLFFFNPIIEVVTFRLRGWRMLGMFLFFLLPAFTCLGHECEDLWRPCDGKHVCTD